MLVEKVKKTIEKYNMLKPGDHVVAAVSGGADSVALLCVLKALESDLAITVSAAHMDHMIRGRQSAKEMAFVRELADGMGVDCIAEARDVPAVKRDDGLSLQEAAREVRYAFLSEMLEKRGADRIAVGHHADDQVETVLMWFVRGASLKGLTGMPPVRDKVFIRPLIEVHRSEIEQYLEEKRIKYVPDTSADEMHYLRNDIRHKLLPLLRKAYNPRIDEAIIRMTGLLRQDDEFLDSCAMQSVEACMIDTDDDLCCSIEKIRNCPEPLYGRMVMNMVARVKGDTRGITFKHAAAVCSLMTEGPSKVVQLPGNLNVMREYNRLIFTCRDEEGSAYQYFFDNLPQEVVIESAGIKLIFNIIATADPEKLLKKRDRQTELLNYDEISFPLCIRSFRPGDRFCPLGMENSKKLKDHFIDEHIPPRQRRKIPLVVSGDRIACVCGSRIDNRFKLGRDTSRVLAIRMVKDV